MYMKRIIGEIKFAQEMAQGSFRNGEAPARMLERMLAKLPCQVASVDDGSCLGFCVGKSGARPCGCALFLSALDSLARSGFLKSLTSLDLQQFAPIGGAHKVDLGLELAWSRISDGTSSTLYLFRFLIALSSARFSVEGHVFLEQFLKERDLQVLSFGVLNRLRFVQSIFYSDFHASFLWPIVRQSFLAYKPDGFENAHALIAGRSLIVLDFEQMSLSSSGVDLPAFELFLSEISRTDAGLVVFSKQTLLAAPEKPFGYQPQFDRPLRKSFRDEKNKWRVESSKVSQRVAPSVEDLLSMGSWDRLVELLAKGQRVIDLLLRQTV